MELCEKVSSSKNLFPSKDADAYLADEDIPSRRGVYKVPKFNITSRLRGGGERYLLIKNPNH